MASVEKIIDKMRNQPRGVSYSEAAKVLIYYRYELKRKRGSHRIYGDSNGNVFVLKEEDPLKISYIKEMLDRLL
ncbi:type II toxin-antitoxin system HicA family toxin [Paenibacillus sp. KACC 21273]|uniref:type II toxin-antitoxin system HicA family toxin n=1 Tax=Paenibacillus sp. KACC 21273 TaxID=3025665 RepID=UPI002365512E|nr:type II toxin-antitoxin system HicA family toxin [Paenibacillus sp. KACC 21273]WDF52456.1 type II toxin-antitoxin system HicA family toxin [Paenibacillus sp. KACC 21273]